MFATWGSEAAYRRSQLATGAPVRPSPVSRGLALRVLGAGDDPGERQRLGQHLIDALSREASLPDCRLVVADRPQVHRHDGRRLQSKTYGYYTYRLGDDGSLAWARIRIYHRTAVQQRVISAKVFLNTLLHEWVHHSDFHGLRLPRSYHTAGFFKRLRALADALEVGFVLPPDPDQPVAPPGDRAGN
ncbi:MAG TPA: hypothetical protein VEK76_11785 [Candidatus Binatia bacterium]|nr:hypothetical protein [Candidatus Binatia bacterium]